VVRGLVVVWVDRELLEKVRVNFPETRRLTYSGVVDLVLRKVLNEGGAKVE